MYFNLILLFAAIGVSLYGILKLINNKDFHSIKQNTLIFITVFIFGGILFILTFMISILTFLNEDIALLLWRFAISIGLIALIILTHLHNSSIIYEKKIVYIPTFIYTFLGSILISEILLKENVIIVKLHHYYFKINAPYFYILLAIFSIVLISSIWIIRILYNSQILKSSLKNTLTILELIYTIILIFVALYFYYQILFRFIILILYLISSIIVLYNFIIKSRFFTIFTNKVYQLIVFHKSGILLFSYNFEKRKEENESILRNSILIGINHILINFINKKEQVNLIKMKNRDIILEYDNELGYAVLFIVDKNNIMLQKFIRNFMEMFSSEFREKIEEINEKKTLIDISDFRGAKQIVEQSFELYFNNTK